MPNQYVQIQPQEQGIKGFHQPYGNHFHYYIYDEILDANDYLDLIRVLDEASQYDVVHLHFNTPGGYLDTAICIINAIRRSYAQVIGYADSQVASAGTMIFLACDVFEVSPFSYFMIHDATQGQYGKQSDLKLQTEHSSKHLTSFYEDIYAHFLTNDEIKDTLRGIDIWMLAEEVTERLALLEEARKIDALEEEELED